MDVSAEQRFREALAAVPLGTAPNFDLACIGTSIGSLGAFTFDALACLICADVVYCYPPTPKHYELVKLTNKNVINLNQTMYLQGTDFNPTYDAIVEEIMRVVRSGKRVTYATQGSPVFHCGTAVRLHRIARQEGFKSVFVPGISSFELLSAELSQRFDITSIQIVSIIRLMQGSLAIDARVPCLLFDLGRYALPAVRETSVSFQRPKLVALAETLRAIYPGDHEIFLMFMTDRNSLMTRTNFEDLVSTLINFEAGATIFMPRVLSGAGQVQHSSASAVTKQANS